MNVMLSISITGLFTENAAFIRLAPSNSFPIDVFTMSLTTELFA